MPGLAVISVSGRASQGSIGSSSRQIQPDLCFGQVELTTWLSPVLNIDIQGNLIKIKKC